MNIEIQLKSFFAYFVFGMIIMFTYELFLRKKSFLCYVFFPLLSFLFIYFIYHINDGKFHIYFLITFALGLIISKICVKFLKMKFKLLKTKKP